ncbi:hypothetical protein [Paenibacillus polysaccharolyticus]|uniref:hypothetical protein n=1 Tax=Paenibacillus polysaccharolyticus TaxID=582692 RepID=UPI00300996C2
MTARYVHIGDGWVLMDDSGACRGRLIELDKQILGSGQKRLYEPTKWFKMDARKTVGVTIGGEVGA